MNILDTSTLIDIFRGGEGSMEFMNDESITTTISCYEILSGIKHKRLKAEDIFFRQLFSEIKILDFNFAAAEVSSEIMAELRLQGKPINTPDVLIAGIAVANGIDKIITRDRDFLNISKVAEIEIVIYQLYRKVRDNVAEDQQEKALANARRLFG